MCVYVDDDVVGGVIGKPTVRNTPHTVTISPGPHCLVCSPLTHKNIVPVRKRCMYYGMIIAAV